MAGMAVLRRAWLLAIALAAVGVGAADGGVNGTTSYSCSVPLPPQDLPPVNCTSGPAASSKTLEDAQVLAWRVAPFAVFHPLEKYFLQVPVLALALH
jgi:hypothetical protein